MPGSNFYNALANARQQTEKLKQQKLAEINAASGALANERSRADDRKARAAEFDQTMAFNREKIGADAANRDKQFSQALELANIGAGTKRDIAGEGNKTKLTIAEQNAQNRLDVEGTRQGGAYQRTEMQQSGANNRTTQNIGARSSEGQLEREFKDAQQKRGIESREGMNSDNNATKERIAQHAADLREKAQASLEKHRNAQLSWQQSSGSMKQAWKEQMDRAELEYKSLTGEMKAAEAVLMTPEQKLEMGGKFKSLPGSLRGGMKSAPQPSYAPGQDVTETGTPADFNAAPDDDMEPMARSMAQPMPQPSQGKPVTQPNSAPVEQPQAAPVPTSNGVTPKAGPQYKEIALRLAQRDKGLVEAGQMSAEEFKQKNAAGAYSREAISMINAAGLAEAKTKNNKVTGEPVSKALRQDELPTDMYGTPMEKTWLNLPGRLVRSVAKGLGHVAAGATDTATGGFVEGNPLTGLGGIAPVLPSPKTMASLYAKYAPGLNARERADKLASAADMRGTKLSSLSNPEESGGTVTDAQYAGYGEAAAEAAGILIPKAVGAGLTKFAPGTTKAVTEFAGSKAKDLYGFLNRPLSDLGGKGAAKEAAAAEVEAAIQAELKAQTERMMAKRAEAAMAKSTASEADAVALNEQFYDDAYMNAVPEGQEALKKMDFKAMFTPLGGAKPAPKPLINDPSAAAYAQQNAGRYQPQVPVEVNPTTGVRTIPLDEAAAPQTLPIDMPDAMPPKMWNPNAVADQGLGSMSPVDSQASGMFKGALKPPTPRINQRHAVLQAQVDGEKAMDMYRAMKETHVPSGAPEQPGLRAFTREEMDAVFAPGNLVGSGEATANITVPPAMQQEAINMGIPPDRLFELMNSIPLDQLPKHMDMMSPEGAKAMMRAIRNYTNNQGYRGMTGGL